MVLWARWSSLTTSQKSSSEVSLHPSISPSCFDFVSVHSFISFLSGLLPIQVKSSRIIPRVSKATMIYSVSLNLMSSMRYTTRYVSQKMGTCSAHALLLIDAYIVTIWPHSLPVNVLFVSTSLLIVSFSLEILWSRSWFCRNQHLQWNQCIPGWLWDRASGEGLSLSLRSLFTPQFLPLSLSNAISISSVVINLLLTHTHRQHWSTLSHYNMSSWDTQGMFPKKWAHGMHMLYF